MEAVHIAVAHCGESRRTVVDGEVHHNFVASEVFLDEHFAFVGEGQGFCDGGVEFGLSVADGDPF